MNEHIGDDELADHSVGLSDPGRGEILEAHLAACGDCSHRLTSMRQVSLVLAGQPTPTMPPDVFARLHREVESLARAAGTDGPNLPTSGRSRTAHGVLGSPGVDPGPADVGVFDPDRSTQTSQFRSGGLPRPTMGRLEENLGARSRRPGRLLFGALGALALAAAVGFGGYVLSAVGGNNEPSADSPLVVDGTNIGPAAAAEPGADSLSSHRFSEAWNCARRVTDGRIIGIQTSVVDGERGLMVYLAGPKRTTRVVFVSGCGTTEPSAGPSAVLPGR